MKDTLQHHGIKGQKWGVRRYQNPDGTLTDAGRKRIAKEAKKDADEYAKAKMYYGKGAGNRRKLIKATVEQKSKDKYYKEEFDRALAGQDMAKRASQARTTRHANDVKDSTAKTARGIVNIATGNPARASAALVAAYGVARFTGLDKKAAEKGKEFVGKVIRKAAQKVTKR